MDIIKKKEEVNNIARFDPNNNVIKMCVESTFLSKKGDSMGAREILQNAFSESLNDYERFISSYFISSIVDDDREKIEWLSKSIDFAKSIDDEDVISAYNTLYRDISISYRNIGEYEMADLYESLIKERNILDKGPFYHGTKADLNIGDELVAGFNFNYVEDLAMNHIYFTSNLNGAGLAAILAKGEGIERIYIVSPTGDFEDDPNVTDKMFPGNLTRSYRSTAPLIVLGEVSDWKKMSEDQKKEWKNKVGNSEGEIIN